MKLNEILNEETKVSGVPEGLSKEGLEKYLELIHKYVVEEQTTISWLFSANQIPDGHRLVQNYKFSESDAKILDAIKVKVVMNLFKEKYKISDKDLLKKIEKEDLDKLPTDIKKVLNFLNKQYSTTVSVKDMQEAEREIRYYYYMSSPKKMVINQGHDGFSRIWTEEAIAPLKFDDLVKFFDHFKIKAKKRPVVKRSAGSYYD